MPKNMYKIFSWFVTGYADNMGFGVVIHRNFTFYIINVILWDTWNICFRWTGFYFFVRSKNVKCYVCDSCMNNHYKIDLSCVCCLFTLNVFPSKFAYNWILNQNLYPTCILHKVWHMKLKEYSQIPI